jgi:hypothetical protein
MRLLNRPIAMPSRLELHHTNVHRFGTSPVCQRTVKQAVTHTLVLSEAGQEPFLERLGKVMAVGQDMGWGVGDAFADTWAEAGLDA